MANTEDSASTSDASGVSTDPYDPMDKVETNTMTFGRQSGNGDRYYERPAQIDSVTDADRIIGRDTDEFRKVENQDYFYRAMRRDEYDAWQAVFKQATPDLRARKYVELTALQINGHQGWASHRQYSEEYLSEKHGYTHLLEVYAPGFVSHMRSIGFKSGKAETGDLSWGLGLTSSNSFGPDKNANRVLKSTYDAKPTGMTCCCCQVAAGQPKEMAKSLAPYFFCRGKKDISTLDPGIAASPSQRWAAIGLFGRRNCDER